MTQSEVFSKMNFFTQVNLSALNSTTGLGNFLILFILEAIDRFQRFRDKNQQSWLTIHQDMIIVVEAFVENRFEIVI